MSFKINIVSFVFLSVLIFQESWTMEEQNNSWIGRNELESLNEIKGTRYTFSQLKEITQEIVQKEFINRPLNGYPILHTILIERRDAKAQEKHKYIELLNYVLKQPNTDKNVYDKHGNNLFCVSIDNSDLIIFNLLLNHCDPNKKNKYGKKALEHALVHGGSFIFIEELWKRTTITSDTKKNLKENFESLLEEWDAERISWFLDLKLVNLAEFIKKEDTIIPQEIDQLFEQGFWIRTLANPENEIEILKKREDVEESKLKFIRHNDKPEKDYTNYSPATFVKKGVSISLFSNGSSSIGVMIRTKNRTIPYWYDGHTEELTRDMDYSEGKKLDNGQESGQFWEVKESLIAASVQQMQDEYIAEKILKVEEEGKDKYKIFMDKRFQRGRSFSWNEGLFRYKKADIFAIYLSNNDIGVLQKAISFRNELGLDLPFLFYNDGVLSVL